MTQTYMNTDVKIALTNLYTKVKECENLIENHGAFADVGAIQEAYNLVKDGVISVDDIAYEWKLSTDVAGVLCQRRARLEEIIYAIQTTPAHIHDIVKSIYIDTLPRNRIPHRISLLDQLQSRLNLYIELADQALKENNAYYTVSDHEDQE